MKLATAPTPPSPARSAATSAPRSKSSCRIETRRSGAATSASGHRREEADLVALAEQHRLGAEDAVPGAAHRLVPAQHLGMRATASGERVAQGADVGPLAHLDRLGAAQGLAQRGEIAHLDLHRSNSAKGR